MQERHYKSILYFISAVILITFAMQGYWNYKNYLAGKQQLINEVQISLDNAVETYYTELAEENLIGFTLTDTSAKIPTDSLDPFFRNIELIETGPTWSDMQHIKMSDSNDFKTISIFGESDHSQIDTLLKQIKIDKSGRMDLAKLHVKKDSILGSEFAKFTSRVIFAVSADTLNLVKLDSLVSDELARKNIKVNHGLQFSDLDRLSLSHNMETIEEPGLVTSSKSELLPEEAQLDLHFSNVTNAVLSKIIFGLLFSFLFIAAIIGCLLYLLKIIKHQKQLAEVKNDLISNITHEFKTPIATIGVAMEAIQNYTATDDKEKALRYSKISSEQVGKLNVMVEKILETARLDSEDVTLNLQETNIAELLEKASLKEEISAKGKTISFDTTHEKVLHLVDTFHFENAINNIIDNAIKYGGQNISVGLKKEKNHISIEISDNGTSLTEANKKQIFEKFYRVPKGNTHDVKGFGIGLYYTKKIIEKHNGQLALDIHPNTCFKIELPYDS